MHPQLNRGHYKSSDMDSHHHDVEKTSGHSKAIAGLQPHDGKHKSKAKRSYVQNGMILQPDGTFLAQKNNRPAIPNKQPQFLSFERKFERLRIAMDPLLKESAQNEQNCRIYLLENLKAINPHFDTHSGNSSTENDRNSEIWQRLDTAIRKKGSYDEINACWENVKDVIGKPDNMSESDSSSALKKLSEHTEYLFGQIEYLVRQFEVLDTLHSAWNSLERVMDNAEDPQVIKKQFDQFEEKIKKSVPDPRSKKPLRPVSEYLLYPDTESVNAVLEKIKKLKDFVGWPSNKSSPKTAIFHQWVELHKRGREINAQFRQLSGTVHDKLLDHKDNPKKPDLPDIASAWNQLADKFRSHNSYAEVVEAFDRFDDVVKNDIYQNSQISRTLSPEIDAFRKVLRGKFSEIWFDRERQLQQSTEPVENLRWQWEHIPNGTKLPAHVQIAYQSLTAKLRGGTQAILPRAVKSEVNNIQRNLNDIEIYNPVLKQQDVDALRGTLTNLNQGDQVEMAIALRERQKTRITENQTPFQIRLESAFRNLRTQLGKEIGWSKTAALMLWKDLQQAVDSGNVNQARDSLKSLNDLLQAQNDPIFLGLKNQVAKLYKASGGAKAPDFSIWIENKNAEENEDNNNEYALTSVFKNYCRESFSNPYNAMSDHLDELFFDQPAERQAIEKVYDLEGALENRNHQSFSKQLNEFSYIIGNIDKDSNQPANIAMLQSDSRELKTWIESQANFNDSGKTTLVAMQMEANIIGAHQLLVDGWSSLLTRLRSEGRLEELSIQTRSKWNNFENKLHHSDDLGAIYRSLEDFANQFEENWIHLGIDPGAEGDLHTQARALFCLFSKNLAAFNHWQAQLKIATPDNFLEFYAKIKNKEINGTKKGADTETAENVEMALEQAVKSRGWKYAREVNIAAIGWEGAGLLCMKPQSGGVDYPDNLPDMTATIDGLAAVSFFYGVSAIIQGKGLWDTRQARKKGRELAQAGQQWLEKLDKNTKDPAVVVNRAIAEEAVSLGKTLQKANTLTWPQKAKIISDILRRLTAAVTFTLLTLIAAGVSIELPPLAPLAIIAGVNFIGAGIAAWNQHDMKNKYQAKAEYMAFLKDNLLPFIDELEASNLNLDEGVRNLIAKAKTDNNLLATMNVALTLFTTGMLAWGTKAALNMAGTQEAVKFVAQIFGNIADSEAAIYAIVTASKIAYNKYQANQKNKDLKKAQTQFAVMMDRDKSVESHDKYDIMVRKSIKHKLIETCEQLTDHLDSLPIDIFNPVLNKADIKIIELQNRVSSQKIDPRFYQKWDGSPRQSNWKMSDWHREAKRLKHQTKKLRTAIGRAFLEEIDNSIVEEAHPKIFRTKKAELRKLLNYKDGKTPKDLDWSISAKINEIAKLVISKQIDQTRDRLTNNKFSDKKSHEGLKELALAEQALEKGDVFEAAKHVKNAFEVIKPAGSRLAPFTHYRKDNARDFDGMKNGIEKIVSRMTQAIELNVFEIEMHQLSQEDGPQQIFASRTTDTLLAKDPAALPASFLWMLQNQNPALSTGASRLLRMMGVKERGINNLRQIPMSAMAVNKMARVMAAPPHNGGPVQTTEISTPSELRRELWPGIKNAAFAPQPERMNTSIFARPPRPQTQQRPGSVRSNSQRQKDVATPKVRTNSRGRKSQKRPLPNKNQSIHQLPVPDHAKTPKAQARKSSGLYLNAYGNDVIKNMQPDALFGLPNFNPNGVANACYLNSSLQILYAIPQMKDLLNSDTNDLYTPLQSKKNNINIDKVKSANKIQTLLRAIYHEATAKNPKKDVIAQLQKKLFSEVKKFKPQNGLDANSENSAHEFLLIILEALNADTVSNFFIQQKFTASTNTYSKKRKIYDVKRQHFPTCYQINPRLGNTVQKAFNAERLPKFNRRIERDIEINDAKKYGLNSERIKKKKDNKKMARIKLDKTTSFTGAPPENFIISVDRDEFGRNQKNTNALKTGEIKLRIDDKDNYYVPTLVMIHRGNKQNGGHYAVLKGRKAKAHISDDFVDQNRSSHDAKRDSKYMNKWSTLILYSRTENENETHSHY